MDIVDETFKAKKPNFSKLEEYGFELHNNAYVYSKKLEKCGFDMRISVSFDGAVSAQVTDLSIGEPYTLHLAPAAIGGFVGSVREEYEALLSDISEKCFDNDAFVCPQSQEIIEYVRAKYGDELEFLWEKLSDTAVRRKKNSGKWYGYIMHVSKRKLGLCSDDIVEIIGLHGKEEHNKNIVDGKVCFAGYHMNKKTWYTIILDHSMPTQKICDFIDDSYNSVK